ncbi:MAG: hypothetical protein K2W85_14170 [Phycisphaerales bacterium]|nr:hypothetical protein [Phycisphaerales bacterium]
MRWIASGVVAVGLVLGAGCERREGASSGQASANATKNGHAGHAGHSVPTAGSDTDALGGPRVVSSDAGAERELVVNAYCPILVGQSVGDKKMCDRRLVLEFKGQKVGFCDPECRTAWNGMSDEQRQKYLDEAMKLEAEPKPGS